MTRWTLALLTLPIVVLAACGGDGNGTDPCEGVACSGLGECLAVDGAPACRCNAGFHADALACVPDACRPADCVHGSCIDPAASADCRCDPGYQGATCADCAPGYRPDGLVCVLIGACDPDPCVHGTCSAGEAGATCACDAGWAGERCDACDGGFHPEGDACAPDSPCNPDPCVHGACTEVNGLADCDCQAGYRGDRCESCDTGYVPDGLYCVPGPGPCDPNPCPDLHPGAHRDRCEVVEGDAACRCDLGYEEVDSACVVQETCDPVTTCAGHGACTGTGLQCDCDDGYDGAHCDACADGYRPSGDECVPLDPPDVCDPNPCLEPNRSRCADQAGKAACLCDTGHSEVAGICVADCDVTASMCSAARSSFGWIVSANGHGAVVVNVDPAQLPAGADQANYRYLMMVHPYQTWGLNASSQPVNTRDVLYDAYMGVRVDGVGTWLDGVARQYVGYYGQDGIPHWVQEVSGLRVETFLFAPWQLARPAMVLLTRVTNPGTTTREVSIYSLQNHHVGNTLNDGHIFPNTAGEAIERDEATGALVETGPGGAVAHLPLGAGVRWTAAAAAAEADPWRRLNALQDLGNEPSVAAGDNRVAGFQAPSRTLAPGEAAWLGVVSAFDPYKDTTALLGELSAAYGGRDAAAALDAARGEWSAWRKPEPAGLSAAERWVYRTSEAVLRMGQVWETTDKSRGQILASLPPGMWSIAWPRDMSYSIAALVRTGHFAEARAALEFVLKADSGRYQAEVKVAYQVSVCRYYGKGLEETDFNADGPNIEFDGFGLFLWVLGEYVRASGDTTLLDAHWDTIQDKVADALMNLGAANGLISPDSSIWEVHWNGRQKQYLYTSLAAAKGLCEASKLAADRGVAAKATAWADEARFIVDGIRVHGLKDGFLAQSVEELASGSGYVDAAVVEAFHWDLFDAKGTTAATTVDRLISTLTVPHGRGLARNDDGGEYDSAEWILIDLRTAGALRRSGDAARVAKADALADWVTAQAVRNFGLIAELHDRVDSGYEGAVPMVGFGAGAYVLDRWLRSDPPVAEAACGVTWQP